MQSCEGSAVTPASPQQVWDAWVDVERWSDGDVIDFAHLNGDFRVGSTIVSKAKGFPKSRLTITRVEPHSVWIDESRSPGVRMTFEHLIDAGEAGTTITERALIGGPLGGIVGRVVRRRLEALFAATTEQVARQAEATHPSPEGSVPR